jgi:tRNA1(Val) A37 N6-methylase TrmN6
MLAAKHFGAKVYATEMDTKFLELARQNILNNNLEKQIFIIDSKGKYLDGVFPKNFKVDFIISNPPYYDKIRATKILWGGKEHELVSGTFGQQFIVQMIQEGWKYLKSNGKIAFMIPKKRVETLIAVNKFIQTIGCERKVVGLKAGNRIRYVFLLNKK